MRSLPTLPIETAVLFLLDYLSGYRPKAVPESLGLRWPDDAKCLHTGVLPFRDRFLQVGSVAPSGWLRVNDGQWSLLAELGAEVRGKLGEGWEQRLAGRGLVMSGEVRVVGAADGLRAIREQLEQAHWARFRPREDGAESAADQVGEWRRTWLRVESVLRVELHAINIHYAGCAMLSHCTRGGDVRQVSASLRVQRRMERFVEETLYERDGVAFWGLGRLQDPLVEQDAPDALLSAWPAAFAGALWRVAVADMVLCGSAEAPGNSESAVRGANQSSPKRREERVHGGTTEPALANPEPPPTRTSDTDPDRVPRRQPSKRVHATSRAHFAMLDEFLEATASLDSASPSQRARLPAEWMRRSGIVGSPTVYPRADHDVDSDASNGLVDESDDDTSIGSIRVLIDHDDDDDDDDVRDDVSDSEAEASPQALLDMVISPPSRERAGRERMADVDSPAQPPHAEMREDAQEFHDEDIMVNANEEMSVTDAEEHTVEAPTGEHDPTVETTAGEASHAPKPPDDVCMVDKATATEDPAPASPQSPSVPPMARLARNKRLWRFHLPASPSSTATTAS